MISPKKAYQLTTNNPQYFFYFMLLVFTNIAGFIFVYADGNEFLFSEKLMFFCFVVVSCWLWLEALDEKNAWLE